jgi:hypothetical protein
MASVGESYISTEVAEGEGRSWRRLSNGAHVQTVISEHEEELAREDKAQQDIEARAKEHSKAATSRPIHKVDATTARGKQNSSH